MDNNAKDYTKYISNPSFLSQKIFSKNFVAIHNIKPVLTLNKSIYVGFNILDLSKLLMYEFHYKYVESKYSTNLLFTDTDSLVYEIKTENIYEKFYKDKNLFDFSEYSLNSRFYDSANKKVIGKMKDELKGKIISEFIGLKSKLYSLVAVDRKKLVKKVEEVKKAKGVNKNVVRKIRHKEFANVLFNKKIIRHKIKRIPSKLHKIGTYDVCKISLSCLYDVIHSLACFHQDIRSK